uniref:Uncharacterized protein n=1 Tax=Oryza barthii TaxID=65489 RepID=A0A0D3FV78_9ORYZ
MEHSKEFIDELHKPLTAEAKAQMVADGKKKVQLQEKQEELTAEAKARMVADGKKKVQLQEKQEDGTALRQGSRLSATDLIRYTLMGIRFAFTAAMHYYHCTQMQMMPELTRTTFGVFYNCFHYFLIAIIILASYMGI